MAESVGRGAGKPSSGGPSTTGGTRRRAVGGHVVESRYLQPQEKKAVRKAPDADAVKTSGKMPDRGRRPVPGRTSNSSRDASKADKGDLQSTLLEGHGTAPPDLDLSAINDKSISRRARQPERRVCGRPKSSVCVARKRSPAASLYPGARGVLSAAEDSAQYMRPRVHIPYAETGAGAQRGLAGALPPSTLAAEVPPQDLSEAMEMVDSQTLLLTLLTVKMENSLATFEEEAEKKLLAVGQEEERLRRKVHEQRCQLQLGQRRRQLVAVLDSQIEMLSPCEAIVQNFREEYQALASALDTTRHELPVSTIHLDRDGTQLLDDVQRELLTTRQLLGELGLDSAADPGQTLAWLQELKTTAQATDLELQRSFAQLLELSAEASKEVALGNQEVWEEAQGADESLQCYFSPESACGEPGAATPKIPAP